jgi:mRNA-degrading endonuclease RelE of RelBE toxin-antitoxin system
MTENSYDIDYLDEIYGDFLGAGLSDEDILKIEKKIKLAISRNIYRNTQSIKGTKNPHIRKLRDGEYRLFIYINNERKIILCLMYSHRKKAYSFENLARLIRMVKGLD